MRKSVLTALTGIIARISYNNKVRILKFNNSKVTYVLENTRTRLEGKIIKHLSKR